MLSVSVGLAISGTDTHSMFVTYDPDERTTRVLVCESDTLVSKVDELLE